MDRDAEAVSTLDRLSGRGGKPHHRDEPDRPVSAWGGGAHLADDRHRPDPRRDRSGFGEGAMTSLVEQQREHFNRIADTYYSARQHLNHRTLKDLIWSTFL